MDSRARSERQRPSGERRRATRNDKRPAGSAPQGLPTPDEQKIVEADSAPDGSAASRLERISKRAYAIYQARGGEHGRSLDDWLEAERQIDAEKQ